MNKYLFNFLALTIIVLFLSIFYYENIYDPSPNKTIKEYYENIRDQEEILVDQKITEEELANLQNCRQDYNCYLKFYNDFNASTTIQRTFSHLSLLLKTYPQYKDYCHQMAHGIGHSEYRKQGGDLEKILNEFLEKKYFKNITSCGSGYYHGLIEEAVKGITDKEELVKYFNNVCSSGIVTNNLEGECIHGLGHASYLQLEGDIEAANFVCKNVTKNNYDRFNCYTGVYMQAVLSLPDILTIQQDGKNKNNFYFPLCDEVNDEMERRACFFESVLQMKKFAPMKNVDGFEKASYADMTKMCSMFNDPLYRLLCIRNISIRSVSENREYDLKKMCIDNVSTKSERIMCVAGFANKLILSITHEKNTEYYRLTGDVCKILNRSEEISCQNIIKDNPHKTYIVDESDLKRFK